MKYPATHPRTRGQAVSEYVLPVALVAALAIPALIQVGTHLGDFTHKTSVMIKGDPSNATGGGGSNEGGLYAYTSNQYLGPNQAVYNYTNGDITFRLPGVMGGGTQTTSVSGVTQTLAQILARMANDNSLNSQD